MYLFNNNRIYSRINNLSSLFGCVILVFGLLTVAASGQGISYNSSSTSHTTPTGIAPGSPAGSYALSGFETINPYSGKINFDLPLLCIGGRGSAGYTMSLQIQQNWDIEHHVEDPNLGPCPPPQQQCLQYFPTHTFTPVDHLWSENDNQGFSPGVMKGRKYGDPRGGSSSGCDGGAHPSPIFLNSLTRLTFVKPDGSELEFRDTLNGGKAMPAVCTTGVSRGTEFVTVDGGSFATFVSDTAIHDVTYVKDQTTGMAPTGTLKWSDGTVYRIIEGKVTKITDRNGNYWLFDYTQGVKVTDSVGRVFNGPSYTRNNPNGGGTITRGVGATYDTLSNRLRSGYAIRGLYDLFPVAYSDPSLNTPYNPTVVSSVVLPDNRTYQFYYNSYGELARIILPTGGEIEYDWQADSGLSGGGDEQNGGDYVVHRRVEKRRVYKENRQLQTETVYQRLTTVPAGEPTSRALTIIDESTYDNSPTPQLLGKVRHFYYGNATPPAFYNKNNPVTDPVYDEGKEYKTESYGSDGTTLLSKVETVFEPGTPLAANPNAAINGRAAQTTNTLGDTNQVTKKTFSYDQYNNQTDVYEYDFGTTPGVAGAFLRRAHTDFVTDTDYTSFAGAHIRHLPVQSWVSSDINGSTKASLSQIEYDNYAADAGHAPLMIIGRTNVVGFDAANYGANYTKRGNPTKITSYENAQNQTGAISAYTQYDILGNVVKAIDAKGNASTIDYTDRFGSPDGEARSNTLPIELGSRQTFAFATSATNALGWVTGYSQFDYYTGAAVDSEDLNGNVSSVFYNDILDRPTQAISANNRPTLRSRKTIVYDDINRKTTVTADLFGFGDNLSKAESFYDALGRTTETRKYESGGGYIVSQTQYDALGRAYKQSNPFRPNEINTNNPIVWTISRFDDSGRVKEVETPDGAKVLTSYAGNAVTVTDQAGKQRRSITNAIGQLKRVDEPTDTSGLGTINAPNQPTNYNYDALNNLIQVQQNGNSTAQCGGTTSTCTQTRSFVYDSLSRLKAATNPESGAISYQYDNNGNLTQKIDARSIQTNFTYDALNRVLTRSYSDSTPAVSYVYENASVSPIKGALTKVSSSISTTEYTGFDVLGRATNHKQTTDGNIYTTGYNYNLSGALVEETYPSGRVVKNVLDTNGDLELVQSKKNQAAGYWNYAKSFSYTAAGAVSSMQLGNGKWESTIFNSRLQPTQIALGTVRDGTDKLKLNYDYGGSDNNGNVKSQTITVGSVGTNQGFTATQNYVYDSLNRLQSATETISNQPSWKQSFLYDRYGNRSFETANTTTIAAGSLPKVVNPEVLASNNRFKADQDGDTIADYLYDAAGNTTKDATGRTFVYDAENKQKSVSDNTGTIGTYFYDGDGKRVKKIAVNENGQPETTVFVYDALGKLVAEYSNQTAGNQVSYLTSDNLGTPRINTDANGQVIARHDYLPFGEEAFTAQRTQGLNYSDDSVRRGFATYERDDEVDEDFAEARYYNYKLGRFNSVDPILITGKRLLDPQQINLYIYVRNNPLKFSDPDGEDVNLVNPTEEGRQKALSKIRANMSQGEADNIDVRYNEKTKKYEVFVKDSSAVDLSKASVGYQDLVDRVNNHDLILNFNFLSKGESTAVELNGVLSTVTQQDLTNNAGGFVSPQSDGSYAVVVAEGGVTNGVQGVTRLGAGLGQVGQISFPDYLVVAHELFAETLKYTPAGSKLGLVPDTVEESEMVVAMENQYRNFHKMNNVRTGGDHGVLQFVVTVDGSSPRKQRKRRK